MATDSLAKSLRAAFAGIYPVVAWLADRSYYHLELKSATDNPDQRISEDLNQFTSYVLTLSLGLLTAVVSLGSFLGILWGLSGPANIPLGNWELAYPCLSCLGGAALRGCGHLADDQNRTPAGAIELRPATA